MTTTNLLTHQEMAKRLRISPNNAYGVDIPYILIQCRPGSRGVRRYEVADVDAYLAGQKHEHSPKTGSSPREERT